MERSLNEYDLLKVFCVLLVIIGHVLNMYDAKGMVCIAEVSIFLISPKIVFTASTCLFLSLFLVQFMQYKRAKQNIMKCLRL